MKKLLLFILLSSFLTTVWAGNIEITKEPTIDLLSLGYDNVTTIEMSISWENSWRDEHNWDAVYVFLKYKRSTDISWSHVLLRDNFHVLSSGYTYYPAKDPAGARDKSTGLFIYRSKKGEGNSTVSLKLAWMFSNNGLTRDDFLNGMTIEASAIEMVYIPKGPFRPGDQFSKYCFQKPYRQIRPEWDLITPETQIHLGSWQNSNPANLNPMDDDRGPDKVCNHDNDPRLAGYCGSYWLSEKVGEASITFKLAQAKPIRYVAMELYYYPVSFWRVSGGKPLKNGFINWTELETFSKTQAPVNSPQSYPATQAVKIDWGDKVPDAYEYYKFDLKMENAGVRAYVRTISMTDKNLEELTEDAYVIDGAGNEIVFNNTLGLNIKDNNTFTGTLDANYAVGFEGFFTMKYEISQHQYVNFLNKLNVDEQKLRTIGDALDNLEMGDYVYGAGNHKTPVCRNGIVIGALQDNRYAFACNLTPGGTNSKGYNEDNDGLNIACNFLSPKDMLAYAAWSGLRPLSELEYEKMGHQTIDSLTGKVPAFPIGGYAWGNTVANFPAGNSFSNVNQSDESLSSANVNVGGRVSGPVRVGSFRNGTNGVAQSSGASFYGVMELSGNLAEIYYRSEPGRQLLSQDLPSHGKGYLTNGDMPTDLNRYWGNPDVTNGTFGQSLILRGGNFSTTVTERARLSDRGESNGYGNDLNRKDSTVTFRLGHSVTAYEWQSYDYYPDSWIKNENGVSVYEGTTVWDTVCTGTDYTIRGSDPEEEGLTPSGELRYVWYYMTDNGNRWLHLEGKNGKDLHLTAADLDHYSTTYRNVYYKRRIYTPTQFAESGVVGLRVGTNSPFTRDKDECIQKNNQINGVLVESAPQATFSWYALVDGKPKVLDAFYTTKNSSYLSVIRDSFPGVKEAKLICEVTTIELGCKKEVSVGLTIEDRPTSGINSASFTQRQCGRSAVKDLRDDQIYTTVLINNQCWMAENMRYAPEVYKTNNWIRYSPVDSKGTTYGCEYYPTIDLVSNVCPEGWVVPSSNDFNALLFYANSNGADNYGRYRLKAGNFWTEARDDLNRYHDYVYAKDVNSGGKKFPTMLKKGFNTFGFGLMGGGFHGYDPRNPSNCRTTLMARRDRNWQYLWILEYANSAEFRYWTADNYYVPVRCILQSTSVD